MPVSSREVRRQSAPELQVGQPTLSGTGIPTANSSDLPSFQNHYTHEIIIFELFRGFTVTAFRGRLN